MGMDVYGVTNDAYFRNNVWWWRPLWEYCVELYGDRMPDGGDWGHYNDGQGLDGNQANELADVLQAEIDSGRTAEYETNYRQRLADLPMTPCSFCNSTGIRTDAIGVEHGMPDKELSEATAIMVGRTHGTCNACGGMGKTASFQANYPFSVENVQEFVDFLRRSGGFEVH